MIAAWLFAPPDEVKACFEHTVIMLETFMMAISIIDYFEDASIGRFC